MPDIFDEITSKETDKKSDIFDEIEGDIFDEIAAQPSRWSTQSPSSLKMTPDTLDPNAIAPGMQDLQGAPVAPGMAAGVEDMGSPDPLKGFKTLTKPIVRAPIETAGSAALLLGGISGGNPKTQDALFQFHQKTKELVSELRPDSDTSFAGKFLDGVLGIAPYLATGGTGLVSLLGNSAASGTDALEQGVDEKTATGIGLKNLIMTTAMLKAPFGGQSLAGGTAKGAGITVGIDIADKALEKGILTASDYEEIADQVSLLDPESLGQSALMGVVFGAKSSLGKPTMPSWYYGLTNKERALVPLTVQDLKKRGWTDARLARMDPDYFKAELAKRMATEQPESTQATPAPSKTSETLTRIKKKLGMPTPEEAGQEPLSATPVPGPEGPTKAVEPGFEPPVQDIDIEGSEPVQSVNVPGVTESVSYPTPLEVAREHVFKDVEEGKVTPEVAEQIVKNVAFDAGMPGYFGKEVIRPYFKRIFDHAQQTGEEVSSTDLDIGHVSGMNSELGHNETNKHMAAISQIIKQTFENEIGPDRLQFGRHGGDEMKVLGIGIPKADLDRAAQNAKIEVEKYVDENNLRNLTGEKELSDGSKIKITKDVSLHINTESMNGFKSVDDFLKHNDAKGVYNELRGKSKETRTATPAERSGSIKGGSTQDYRADRAETAATSAEVTPQPATTTPKTQLSKQPLSAKIPPMTPKKGAGETIPTKKTSMPGSGEEFLTDDRGNKITFYHGSPNQFGELKTGIESPRKSNYKSASLSFTTDEKLSKRYAGKTGAVKKYNLKLKNPIDLGDGESTMTIATFLKNIGSNVNAEDIGLNPTGWTEQWRMVSYYPQIVKVLSDLGYDGATWVENRGKSKTYSVFDPKQAIPTGKPESKPEGGNDFKKSAEGVAEIGPLYHGSPYKFDKFKYEAVGSGAGSQTFGYGYYFSDGEEIAHGYATRKQKGYTYTATVNKGGSPSEKIFLEWYEPIPDKIIDKINNAVDKFLVGTKEGRIIKNQIMNPQSIFHKQIKEVKGFASGGDYYFALSEVLSSDEKASRLLRNAGITGIRYPAGTIRGVKDSKARNYVIFDLNDITIEGVAEKTVEPPSRSPQSGDQAAPSRPETSETKPRTRDQIERALVEGKPVTDEELSAHPDLAKRYGKKPTVKESLPVQPGGKTEQAQGTAGNKLPREMSADEYAAYYNQPRDAQGRVSRQVEFPAYQDKNGEIRIANDHQDMPEHEKLSGNMDARGTFISNSPLPIINSGKSLAVDPSTGEFVSLREMDESPKKGSSFIAHAVISSRTKTAKSDTAESSTTQRIKEATEKTAKTIDDFIDSSGPAAGLSVRPALEKQVDDTLKLPGGEVKSVNSEVEERWQASKGITQKSLKERMKERLLHAWEQRKHFPGLDYKKDARAISILREFENVPEFSKKTAAEITSGIVAGMGPKKYDVFTRNIILPDLIKDIDNGLYEDRDLPFGYKHKAEVQADLETFRKVAEANPDIMAALKRRNEFNAVLKSQLVENELLPKEVLEDDAYFHHQVLMYMEARSAAPGVSSKDVRTHTKGFQRGRKGSSKDFNTEYIESEFEYIAQAIAQLKTVETLKKIRTAADIALEVKKQAKEAGLENWRQAIPEDYTTWQPKPGTIFYKAVSIPEKLVDEIMSGKLAEVSKDDLHSIIAKGARNPEWVIPERLAKTLDEFRDFSSEGFDRFAKSVISSWKQWVLMNPLRVLKYNINNMSGDLDIAMAYDPRILKYFREAVGESWGYYKGKSMTRDIREALEYGVIGSGISLNEIPDIKDIGVFRILTGRRSDLIERYWEKSKGLTTARENILRLAAFKYFKEQIAAGKKVYGASVPELVDAERDPNRKAALLARDLIGDYGNISKAGQWLRERMIPFFSWMEINAPRYVRMVRNLAKEDQSGAAAAGRIGAVAAGKAAKTTAKFAVKASGLYALIMLWNAVAASMFDIDDDENRALYQDREQLHIILGKREDGTIITMRFQGAFSDMLDWVGLGNAPADVKDLATGKKTMADQAKEMVKAPINKIVNASHPILKTVGEVITGKSIYPDVFKPKPIRDRMEHVARALTLDLAYRYIAGKPTRGASKDMLGVIAYSNDPAEAAYWNTRKKVYEFMESKGKEAYAYTPTKRSNAMYYFKQAKRFGDEKAAKKYLREYVKLGGSKKGYISSMKNGAPLASLKKEYRGEFEESLSAEEKRNLEIAVKWYNKHLSIEQEDIEMLGDFIEKFQE